MANTVGNVIERQLTLDELADVANREHHECEAAIGSVLQHAIASGQALTDAKAQLKHGEWLPWLDINFDGSRQIADAYRKVAANCQRVGNLDSLRQALKLLAGADDQPHVSNNSGDNEWYTPAPYVAAARDVLGGIDLDPASTAAANAVVRAETFYSADDDGLSQPWAGRVWMNPPYAAGIVDMFAEKMAGAYEARAIEAAIVLVNNATETAWFQRLARVASAICFPDRRVRFWNAEGEPGAPLQGQAFLYLGNGCELFAQRFSEFGIVMEVRAA